MDAGGDRFAAFFGRSCGRGGQRIRRPQRFARIDLQPGGVTIEHRRAVSTSGEKFHVKLERGIEIDANARIRIGPVPNGALNLANDLGCAGPSDPSCDPSERQFKAQGITQLSHRVASPDCKKALRSHVLFPSRGREDGRL
ncbi:hypothetical protein [Novosphingopyxis sp. YJ-S2-01]|uniref:hypothetical protein n=1 Tax=Novosphingopyxis sp. YJ-S2-01 TaxID=2794021 RepID=UPI0018DCA52A|nr:hypothetical protein [Novosphingopyxis sp. YJ-S2-01]MBH9536909.1 hypothetical protein [Novosphingopyxis sp. YJ-S2-01]